MARIASIRVSVRIPRPLEEVLAVIAEHEEQSFSEAVRELLVAGLEARGFKSTYTDAGGAVVDEWKLPESVIDRS